jgi:glutathione peroxidase-family protein
MSGFPTRGLAARQAERQLRRVWSRRAEKTQPDGPGDIAWNFAKFLIGKDGRVCARYGPRVEPTSGEIRNAIGEALAE